MLKYCGIIFQRTETRKKSPDPGREAKLDRIEEARDPLDRCPDRIFAYDDCGRPGSSPPPYPLVRRYYRSCCSIGDHTLWGFNR